MVPPVKYSLGLTAMAFIVIVANLIWLAANHTDKAAIATGQTSQAAGKTSDSLVPLKPASAQASTAKKSDQSTKIGNVKLEGNSITSNTSSGYSVRGNKIYDSAGNVRIFHGLNRPSLEWSSTGQYLSLADYTLMSKWKANVIRLPLNQKYWLQNTDNYKTTVAQQVTWIQSLGMDVILDLHWSVGGDMNKKADQYNMADEDSRRFWKDVAAAYKDNHGVLFELYNEPRGISWDVWQNGGQTSDESGSYKVVGMQQLYDDVRASGAQNIIIIGGIDWAYDLSEVASGKHKITGTNIAYASHPYDYYGKNTVADWDRGFGKLSETAPVLLTEFGTYNCNTTLYSDVLAYAKTKGIGWAGWAWWAGDCGFPSLISDWNGTLTATGSVVKAAF